MESASIAAIGLADNSPPARSDGAAEYSAAIVVNPTDGRSAESSPKAAPMTLRRITQGEKQEQVAFQVIGNQEVFFDVLVAVLPQPGGNGGIREQETDLVCCSIDGVDALSWD